MQTGGRRSGMSTTLGCRFARAEYHQGMVLAKMRCHHINTTSPNQEGIKGTDGAYQ